MIGFEDAQLADGGFAAGFSNPATAHQVIKHTSTTNGAFMNRFAQNGGKGDEIKLDLLKIQKKIDVKRLKY